MRGQEAELELGEMVRGIALGKEETVLGAGLEMEVELELEVMVQGVGLEKEVTMRVEGQDWER